MSKIGILIDSTVYLDEEIIEKYEDMEVVSLNIVSGTTSIKDIDITEDEIMKQMREGTSFKTSQPSPAEFTNSFNTLFEKKYDKIFCFVLSEKVSGTYQSGNIAKESHSRKDDIHIFSTSIANFGLTNCLLAFIDEVKVNTDFNHLITFGEDLFKNSYLTFSVTELQHLFRGGRLSKIQVAVGVLLRIKPIIGMIEGKLEVVQKARSFQSITDYFCKLIDKFATNYKTVYLRLVDLKSEEHAKHVEDYMRKYSNIVYSKVKKIGSVFTVHLGESGYGITLTGRN